MTDTISCKKSTPIGDEWWELPDGSFHRADGPAFASPHNGYYGYYINGGRHRTDGPARIWMFDNNYEWWLEGREYSFDEWLDQTTLDDERKLLLKLQYG
jgi:hypothetical protein